MQSKDKFFSGQAEKFLSHKSRTHLFIISVLFIAAFAIRVYPIYKSPRLVGPRQYRCAIIARDYFFETLQSIPDWERKIASINKDAEGIYEPPIMELLASLGYRIAGGEYLWIPKMLSVIFWLGGGVFLYALTRGLISSAAAIFSTAFYLFLPFGIAYSQSFAPDPLMLCLFIASIWAISRYHIQPSRTRLAIATALSAAAMFVKPVCLFAIFATFILANISRQGIRKTLTDLNFILFGIGSFLPTALFYFYGIYVGTALRDVAEQSFFPSLYFSTAFWLGWLNQIDIVIGTHRILQSDIAFKNLGLVIVDEEQRFGVNHKEKLKKLRTMVDVLTLSATPIPRTLELSLVGIRDLSIINTPPVDRQAIKTHVLEFDRDFIRDAIRRELSRGGQVFFLHDRVHSIHSMEKLVREIVPEARTVVAHGRMKPRELEEVMVKFIRKDHDVLISTTIIGSGIDIPSANTIIINRADRFGLSQLYQLRGRVGRSREAAFAYLIIPRGAVLAPDARKRLQVIKEFTEPGSGFRIAAQDLELRGAGNLLGASQSGHIAAVGYELYIQLLESTIRELKGEKPSAADEIRPEIHLGVPAFIPETFIPDMNRRLTLYKRISLAETEVDLADIRTEMEDTCGFVAPETENLLQVIDIRNRLKAVLAKKLDYDGKDILISFHGESVVDPSKIVKMTQKKSRKARFTPDLKLRIPAPGLTGTTIISEVKAVIGELIH